MFVPFPSAVDDHQTTNAKFLVDEGGGWLVQQRDLTPEWLADLLQALERGELIQRAMAAKSMQKTKATAEVVAACEALARKSHETRHQAYHFVGVAARRALFVPFPYAVDDHQTTNARFLVDAGGGWLVQQRELTPE